MSYQSTYLSIVPTVYHSGISCQVGVSHNLFSFFAERQNLTMRMQMRRFTRQTNAFSKKIENHTLAIALYFMHYNFVSPHKSLSNPYPATPAMVAGVDSRIWTYEDLVILIRHLFMVASNN
ncbi:IS1 family transposase [Chloroflexota bacterium]